MMPGEWFSRIPLCLEARKAVGLAGFDEDPSFCRLCGFGPCNKLVRAKYRESGDADESPDLTA
jgi:hypothetical protein